MKKGAPILLYNTLTRTKELFKPIKKGSAGLYSCGPTVYWDPTIGNWRAYIFVDTLRRMLTYNGYAVKHVMNVTDVGHLVGDGDVGEDKMEKAALREHTSAKNIADHYFAVFKGDMAKLHIIEPGVWCKATEHITEQIALIKQLEKKGYTYRTRDGIYFDSSKFKDYGKLAKLHIKGLEAGKRVGVGEKKHKTDFALWKFSEEPGKRQQEWDSPWGLGYPGWHIECSAMSMKYLGSHFDIHTGGEDHIPVHHTNEIAQSEAATGKRFVNYWMHNAFLTFHGEKVSKSKGGLYTLRELEELGYKPEHYRYLCLLAHYRKPLDFSLEALDSAKNAYERLVSTYLRMRSNKIKSNPNYETFLKYDSQFKEAVNNDLNLPAALGIVWNVIADGSLSHHQRVSLINRFDSVLGLGLEEITEETVPREVLDLVNERAAARATKNWKRSDQLREKIQQLGYDVEDTAKGQNVKRR